MTMLHYTALQPLSELKKSWVERRFANVREKQMNGVVLEVRLLPPAELEQQTCRPYRLQRIQTVLRLKFRTDYCLQVNI